MKHVTTCSDYRYMKKGIAMCKSILKHTKDVTIHYLCLDEKVYSELPFMKGVKKYRLRDIGYNQQLTNHKLNHYNYFCWCCASFFTKSIVSMVAPKSITYIDADIYFYKSLDVIHEAIGDKSVGLFRHRQWPMNEEHIEGKFNVGVVYFAGEEGFKLLRWWSDAVLYKLYPKYATCGDQKYLDAFPDMCNNVFIDGDIGHSAAWLWQLYDLSKLDEGKIIWNGEEQDLVFNHFSQFEVTNSGYIPSTAHMVYSNNNKVYEHPYLKELYDQYYQEVK